MGQYFQDPRTGKVVWQDDNGQFQLKDRQGNIFQAPAEKVSTALASGEYFTAAPAEVEEYDRNKMHGGLVDKLKTGAESAAAGAFDVATAPVALPIRAGYALAGEEQPDWLRSGRQVIEDIAAVSAEATGGEGEVAAREYSERARARAETNPMTATGARFVGEVVGGGMLGRAAGALGEAATGALGSRALGTAVGMGAEGAVYGGAQASEEAYLGNVELTGEQVLAGMGLGAVIGGGAGLAIGKAQQVFGRTGSRGATPVDSPKLGAPYRTEAEALEEVAERRLGQDAGDGLGEKLRDALESTQTAATGAEKRTLEKYGALRWDDEAIEGRMLWRNRGEILEGATKDITDDLSVMTTRSREVFDEVVDAGLKRENVAAKLEGDTQKMLEVARAEASRLQSDVRAIAVDVEQFGNKALTKRIRQFADERIKAVSATDDAAEAFIELDKAKRGLQKWKKTIETTARRTDDALKSDRAFALAKRLDESQERTRQVLMDENLWGGAGRAQREINAAWEEWFRTRNVYDSSIVRRTGTDFSGRSVQVVDPKKVSGYVRSLGKQESALVDEHVRGHIDATKRLTETIERELALEGREGVVQEVRAAAEKIGATLEKADKTVKVANQIDAVISAEQGVGFGGLGGAFGGGLLGGAPGAIAGAALGVITRPGQLMRQAAAVQALASNVGLKIDGSLSRFMTRFDDMAAGKLPKAAGAARKTKRAAKRAALPAGVSAAGFAEKGEDRRAAFKRQAEAMRALAQNPEELQRKMAGALGDTAGDMTGLAGSTASAAQRVVNYLAAELPSPVNSAGGLFPQSLENASDAAISKWMRQWSAAMNPLSVLEDLERGRLTHEQVDAMRVGFPELYTHIRSRVIQMSAERSKPLPYRARVQLEILFDGEGVIEPSQAPGFLSRIQLAKEQLDQQGGPNKPPPRGRPARVAESMKTPTEEIEL